MAKTRNPAVCQGMDGTASGAGADDGPAHGDRQAADDGPLLNGSFRTVTSVPRTVRRPSFGRAPAGPPPADDL